MKQQIFAGWRFVCLLPSLLLSFYVFGADTSQLSTFGKIDDRKIQNLIGNVSEVRYTDGTLIRFDEAGRIVRFNNKQFSYQDGCKYILEEGVVTAFDVKYLGDVRREVFCDTGKKTEEYIFDTEGRLHEHLIYSYPVRKYQYYYRDVEKLPCKEMFYCDTIPSGALTYYYIYLKTDEEGNWLQRSVKVSGGKDVWANRMYVETRRLKYDLTPTAAIVSVKGGTVKLNGYNSERLNINKLDKQAAYDRGKESIGLLGPKEVEVGEEFEIAFDMKQRPKDIGVDITEQFELLRFGSQYHDFRTNTMIVAGDTITQYQLVIKLKARQKGNLALPSLKVRFRGKLNISAPWNITVIGAQSVSARRDYNPEVRLIAVLDKDTVRVGESALLTLKVYTTYSKVTPVRLSQPQIVSCTVQELSVDSMKWNTISFENVSYHVGEYKKFQLTPTKAGKVEISHFWYDCILSRFVVNPKFVNGMGNMSSLLGAIEAAVTVVSTSSARTEKRNESVHTDPLYLQVLP